MTSLAIVKGGAHGTCSDGDSVTFPVPFPAGAEIFIMFGAGGLSYSSTLGAVNQYRAFSAEDVTTTGFTARLKLSTLGTLTPRTATFSPSPGTPATATKTQATEAQGLLYTASYQVEFSVGGTVTLESRPSGGGAWTFEADRFYSGGTWGSQTLDATRSGLTANSEFRLTAAADGGEGTAVLTAASMAWNEASGATETSATPSGVEPVKWQALVSED